MLRFLKIDVTSSTKAISCLLFCWIESLEVLTTLSMIGMEMVRRAWSDVSHQFGWIE